MNRLAFFVFIIIVAGVGLFGFAKNTDYLSVAESVLAKPEARIVFVGDMMFDRHIRIKNKNEGYKKVISPEIVELLKNSDLAVGNLEGVISDYTPVSPNSVIGSPSNFIFTFPPAVAGWLYDNNFKVISLGNNHVTDFGQGGISQTKKYLNESTVKYIGEPGTKRGFLIKEINGLTFAFVNYNQFGGISASETINNIKQAKKEVDYTIVYAHWGEEYASIPSAGIKALAYEFSNAGVDLIVGSHPHVIQPKEEYNGTVIYYSLGNFIFDQYFNENVSCGLLLEIQFTESDLVISEHEIRMKSNGKSEISSCKS